MKNNIIHVNEYEIRLQQVDKNDYINITDIAKFKNLEKPADVILELVKNKIYRCLFRFMGKVK